MTFFYHNTISFNSTPKLQHLKLFDSKKLIPRTSDVNGNYLSSSVCKEHSQEHKNVQVLEAYETEQRKYFISDFDFDPVTFGLKTIL